MYKSINEGEHPSVNLKSIAEILCPSLVKSSYIRTRDIAMIFIASKIQAMKSPGQVRKNEKSNNLQEKIANMSDSEKERKINEAIDFIKSDVFPHMINPTLKSKFLYYCIAKLLRSHITGIPDDRDSLINKRAETAGMLLGSLFQQLFCKVLKDFRERLPKKFPDGKINPNLPPLDFSDMINSTIITKG